MHRSPTFTLRVNLGFREAGFRLVGSLRSGFVEVSCWLRNSEGNCVAGRGLRLSRYGLQVVP